MQIWSLLQDYEAFFEALECEHLYSYLQIDIPETEVEWIEQHEEEIKVPF